MILKKSTRAQEIAFAEEVMQDPEFLALPERVQRTLRHHVRGLRGEKDTAFMLDRKFGLNDTCNLLIHDLRIPDGLGGFAQFDHILFSRLSRTASIFESKNYSGRISKNEHGEWHVWYRGQRRPVNIPNPVEQARRQGDVLQAWLQQNGMNKAFEKIGIFVAIPPEAEIDRSKIGSDEPIHKADNLFKNWLDFGGVTTLGRMFSSGVSAEIMLTMARRLVSCHVPEEDIYARLGIGSLPVPDMASVPIQGAGSSLASAPDEEIALGYGLDHDNDPAADLISEVTEHRPDPGPACEERAPETVTATQASVLPAPADPPRPAGSAVEVCVGITERTLPDGRIAFRANRNDDVAKQALASLCKGKAAWNPRFYNWVCSPEVANVVRAELPAAVVVALQP